MGYGLDFSSCAVNGSIENLHWVSPKSGRVVSSDGAKGWEDRLIKLPSFLIENEKSVITKNDILDGLNLTEYFLVKRVYSQSTKNISSSRKRLIDYLGSDSFVI